MSEQRYRPAATAAVGLGAGLVSGFFGVGGGVIVVPAIVMVLGMPQRLAHGTSLASIMAIAPMGVVGFAVHGSVDWAAALLISAGAMAGAVAGTALLHRVSQRWLQRVFAVFVLVAAIRLLILLPDAAGRGALDEAMVIALLALGVLSGTAAGLLGIGGGVVIIPVLVILMGVPDAVAKGTALAVTVPTAMVGTWRNVRKQNVDARVAATVGPLGAAAAFAGSQIAVGVDDTPSRILFAVLLLGVAAQLLLRRSVEPVEGGD